MVKKNIVLITRTWFETKGCENGKTKEKREEVYKKNLTDFFNNISDCLDSIIILINKNREKNNHTEKLLETINSIKRKYCHIDVKPWGDASGALNIGLNKLFTKYNYTDYILIASKEVDFSNSNIQLMLNILNKESKMLVVGYALKANLPNLNNLEEGHII
jgi:hypothetical protein